MHQYINYGFPTSHGYLKKTQKRKLRNKYEKHTENNTKIKNKQKFPKKSKRMKKKRGRPQREAPTVFLKKLELFFVSSLDFLIFVYMFSLFFRIFSCFSNICSR